MFKQVCQVVHSSCRSICHSSEPLSSIVCISSPRPTCLGHRCSVHNLVGSHYLCLPSYGSPPSNIRQCNCLIIVISPGWSGMPWFWDLVQLSTEIPLYYQYQQHFSNSPATKCFKAIHNISTSMSDIAQTSDPLLSLLG